MKNVRWLITAVIAVVLLLLVVFYYRATALEPASYRQAQGVLQEIETLDAKLNADLLLVRSGLLRHYDTLNESTAGMVTRVNQLKQHGSFGNHEITGDIDRYTNELATHIGKLAENVERFKTAIARLRMSLMYVNVIGDELFNPDSQNGSKSAQQYSPRVGILLNSVLQHVRNPGLESKSEVSRRIADLEKGSWPPATQEKIAALVSHVEVAVHSGDAVQAVIDDSLAISVGTQVRLLEQLYTEASDVAQRQANFFWGMIYMLAIGLLCFLSYVLFRYLGVLRHLTESQGMLHLVLDTIPDRVFWKGLDLNYLGCNRLFSHDAGFSSPREIVGKDDTQLGWAEQANLYQGDDREVMESGIPRLAVEKSQTMADGRKVWLETNKIPLTDHAGNVIGVLGTYQDITQRKQDAETIHFMAHHDPLTGLTNRYEFERRLEKLLKQTRRNDTTHTLLYVDLDQFKIINDTCGHMAGDAMLKKLAKILTDSIGENDVFARLGGDEFGMLIENTNLAQASVIAEKLLDRIKKFRFVWDDKIFSIGASIGMVLVSALSGTVAELLSAADIACYAAKDMGRNRIHVYSDEDAELVKRHGQMQWVSRISTALEEDRFTMYAQCIVPMDDSATDHRNYELLVRMVDEKGQLVQPGAFLPAAERFDLMPALDRWVVKKAFEYLEGLCAKHADNSGSTLFVNVSGVTLGDREFVDYVLGHLRGVNSSRSRICFEITETAAITNLNQAIEFINAVKQEGCQIALDDFGSGMSSFSYLRTLPIDYVKIDGSIIRGILDDPMNAAIVASVNQIAHSAGLQTIAEWVETGAIQQKLQEMGIDYVQGYAVQGPRPLADFPDACICSL
jgi:diguanylate cyclase (GGDEF)-like protein/PAS domain S-box-containing protein